MVDTEAHTRFNVPYFPPVSARSVFIMSFTDVAPEEMWEGAATIMGNSVLTWRNVYWRDKRQKLVDKVVTGMADLTGKMATWG